MIIGQLQTDMKTYMRGREATKIELKTVRMAISALKNKKIELGRDLTEIDEISVLKKELKSYKESLASCGDRTDWKNELEVSIKTIEKYVPSEMSEDEARKIIEAILKDNNISSKKETGKAMKAVMAELKGKLDGKVINKIVSSFLI